MVVLLWPMLGLCDLGSKQGESKTMMLAIEIVVVWVLVSIPLGCCIGTLLRERGH